MFAEKAVIKATFHDALVVHVDLSAVAWFLAITLLFGALLMQSKSPRLPYARGASALCFASGCLCIALAPILGNGTPIMSNYVPVYTSPLFFLGLGLIYASLVLGVINTLLDLPSLHITPSHYGILGAMYILLLALLHFAWSYTRLDTITPGTQDYYEVLFWAGGHILQLAYTQLLLVAWLWLAFAAKLRHIPGHIFLIVLFSIYPLVATLSPIAFLNGSEPYDLHFFTLQMRHGGGIAAIILGLYVFCALLRSGLPSTETRAVWLSLVVSLLVFTVGGTFGHAITDSNTIIPAHYHGSIVGTTQAFMCVIYLLLPKLGYGNILHRKLTLAQPLLYGGGSILHATGLAIAGGHGVARKTVGALDESQMAAEAALQVMRLGGALAILGGALFVALVVISVRRKGQVRA